MTREELFEAVWAQPLTKLSTQLNVSGSYLARVCDSLDVPRPERGYWAKLLVGKAAPKPELPAPQAGTPTSWKPGDYLRRRRPESKQRSGPVGPRASGDGAIKTHALLQGAMAQFLKTRVKGEYVYLKPFKSHLVDITVSEGGLQRALIFANALFLALEERGYRVGLQDDPREYLYRPEVDPLDVPRQKKGFNPHSSLWAPGRVTIAKVKGQRVGLLIVEVARETVMRLVGNSKFVTEDEYLVKHSRREGGSAWSTTKEVPNGRLRLVAYSPIVGVSLTAQWQEPSPTSLVDHLPRIVRGIEKMTRALPELVAEAERKREAERRAWDDAFRRHEMEADQRSIQESISKSCEQLDELIQSWARDRARADFLDAMEAEIQRLDDSDRAALKDRLDLARNMLGSTSSLLRFRKWLSPEERYVPKHIGSE